MIRLCSVDCRRRDTCTPPGGAGVSQRNLVNWNRLVSLNYVDIFVSEWSEWKKPNNPIWLEEMVAAMRVPQQREKISAFFEDL
jgi:hypothetical protein